MPFIAHAPGPAATVDGTRSTVVGSWDASGCAETIKFQSILLGWKTRRNRPSVRLEFHPAFGIGAQRQSGSIWPDSRLRPGFQTAFSHALASGAGIVVFHLHRGTGGFR